MEKSLYGLLFVCVLAQILLTQGYTMLAFGLVVACCVLIVLWLGLDYQRLVAFLADDGKPLPKFSAFTDAFDKIHHQKQHTQKKVQTLQNNVSQLDRLIGAMPIGLMVLDETAKVVWANSLAKQQFEIAIYDNLLAVLTDCHDSDFNETFLDRLTKLPIADRQFDDIKLECTKTLWLNTTLAPFYGSMTLLMSEDISEKTQFFVSKTDFVANVSHELKTPLTVIQGFLETMREYPDLGRDERDEFLALMTQESTRMLTLVNDLLALSRLENSHNAVHEPVNLSLVCRQVLDATYELAKTHDRTADVSGQIDDNVWIMGNHKDIYSAISNIAFNAIWHTKKGVSLQIVLTQNNQVAQIGVIDTGDGIDECDLPRLTERFYRVDKGRGRDDVRHGSGLGLAIAKHALAQHNARLNIDSQKGVGSRFWTDITTISVD